MLVFENDSLLGPMIDSTSQISKIDSATQIKSDSVGKKTKNKAKVDTTKAKVEINEGRGIKQNKIKPVKVEGFKEPKAITLEQAYKLSICINL